MRMIFGCLRANWTHARKRTRRQLTRPVWWAGVVVSVAAGWWAGMPLWALPAAAGPWMGLTFGWFLARRTFADYLALMMDLIVEETAGEVERRARR